MTIEQPFGTGRFKLYDGTKEYSPDKYCKVVPVDENETYILTSPFDGTNWPRTRKSSRSWDIMISKITQEEFDEYIEYFRGKTANFQPHIDVPAEDYEVIVNVAVTDYEELDFYKDVAVMRILKKDYK